MRKLNVKTVKESSGLIKVWSNQTLTFHKGKILDIIDKAKMFEKGKSIETLRKIVDMNYTKKEYHTTLGNFSLDRIRTTGETAYQRAIFSSEKTKLNTIGEVEWNDLELPVVFGRNPRRPSVDLVGTLDDNRPVLCELKFNSTQSPIYAAIELMFYYYLIQDNCEELDKRNVFHKNKRGEFKWCNFISDSILIVGANKKYWNCWESRYEKQKIDVKSWRNSLPLKIHFFSSVDFDFKKQKETKGTEGKYTPSVCDKTEWIERFI